MFIGSGCKVHLRAGELPKNVPLIVSVSRHLTVVYNDTIYDTFDPTRGGRRCVYGYWTPTPCALVNWTFFKEKKNENRFDAK